MPFSVSHRYAFVHIPKTAGSSMHAALAGKTKIERRAVGVIRAHHATAAQLRNEVQYRSGRRWEDYYSFSFVRNPWERFISICSYLGMDANYVLTEGFWHWMFQQQVDFIFAPSGEQLVTFIGRFESLRQDWLSVCSSIGIQVDLPHLKQSKQVSCKKYYTDHTKNMIAKWYRDDIEEFGYQFPD